MLNKKAVYSGLISEVYTPKKKYFYNQKQKKKKKKKKTRKWYLPKIY